MLKINITRLTLFINASVIAGSKQSDRDMLSCEFFDGVTPIISLLYALQIEIVF